MEADIKPMSSLMATLCIILSCIVIVALVVFLVKTRLWYFIFPSIKGILSGLFLELLLN